MPRSVIDRIVFTLDGLADSLLLSFKRKLHELRYIGFGQIQNERTVELAHRLVSKFTVSRAIGRAAEVLRAIDLHNEAEELEKDENYCAGSNLATGAGAASSTAAGENGRSTTPPGSNATAGKHFVDKNFVELIERVKHVEPILDHLLQKGVISSEMNDQVMSEKTAESRMRKLLYSGIMSKGEGAKDELVGILEKCEPYIMALLRGAGSNLATGAGAASSTAAGEKGGSTTPPSSNAEAPATQLPQQETNGLIHCTEEFKRDLLQREAGSIYVPKPKGQRSRWALLINNLQFDHLSERKGSEKDVENMEKLLKDLDYSVVKHSNLSAEDIDKIVREFSQRREHLQSDSTFVVIMSHGERNVICGIHHYPDYPEKEDLFSIDNIFKHLNNQNCPALVDKPKVIVIQACRGNERGSFLVNDNVTNSLGLEDDGIQLKEEDFICLMACTPDTVSIRHKVEGAFFIQKLVETIKTYAHKDHIEELSRKVRKHFEESKWQMPSTDRVSLTNKFYLFPGL